MPKFRCDVKAFMEVEVEADNAEDAGREAEKFVAALAPDGRFISLWNDIQREARLPTIVEAGGFDVEDGADVELVDGEERELCSQCGDQQCEGCVPLDTPSLDTSFHDHEMDVD